MSHNPSSDHQFALSTSKNSLQLSYVRIFLIAVFSDDLTLLREAIVPIVSNADCAGSYSGITDVHICAG